MSNNNIGGGQSIISTSYYNIRKPHYIPTLFNTHPRKRLVAELMMFIAKSGIQTTYSQNPKSYEDTEIWDNLTITSLSQIGSSSIYTVTLDANSYQPVDALNPYSTQSEFFVRTNDIVTNYLGINAQVVSIDPANHQFNINISVYPGQDITSGFTTGDVWRVGTNAFGRATDQPTALISGSQLFNWYTQIIKETVSADGTELCEKPWIDEDDDGNVIETWFARNQMDTDMRWSIKTAYAFLFGPGYDPANPLLDYTGTALTNKNYGKPIQLMEGLFTNIKKRGLNLTFPNLIAMPFQSAFDLMEKFIVQNFMDVECMAHFMGIDYYQWLTRSLKLDLNTNGEVYTEDVKMMFNGNSDISKSVSQNFHVFNKDGVKHVLQRCDLLNYKLGNDSTPVDTARGHGGSKTAIMFPIGNVTDSVTKESIENVRFGFMAHAGRSREMWRAQGGIHATTPIGPTDELVTWQGAEVWAQFQGMNNAIYVNPR